MDSIWGPKGYDEFNQAKGPGFFGWPYFIGDTFPYTRHDYETNTYGEPYDINKPVNDSRNNTGLRDLPTPVVPAMIYYGLMVLSPVIFLFAACFISAIVSVATGSSWTTVATVGVALLGIGKALGFEEGIIAGAIISGAYFGDKMSPLSDTTNLAPAMAGTDLFTHIRHMAKTTVPTMFITLILFIIIGLNYETSGSVEDVKTISEVISTKFNINPLLFIVPIVVLVMIVIMLIIIMMKL